MNLWIMIFQFTFAPADRSLRILHQLEIIFLSRALNVGQWFQYLSRIGVYRMWCFRIESRIVNAVILTLSLILNRIELFLRDAHAGINFVWRNHIFTAWSFIIYVLANYIHCTFTVFYWPWNHSFQLVDMPHYISTFLVFFL